MTITVEVPTHDIDVEVVVPEILVEISGAPGPPGPSAVSADAGNTAILGSDQLIYVPRGVPAGVEGHIVKYAAGGTTLISNTRLEQDTQGRVTVRGNDTAGYGKYGLRLVNESSGGHTVLQAMPTGGLYITSDTGAAQPLTLGVWANPNDGSQFTTNYQYWKISAGRLVVANYSLANDAQLGVLVETPDRRGLSIGLASGQTAPAIEVRDNANAVLFQIGSTGTANIKTMYVDPGPGSGVGHPIMRLRCNAGENILYADGSSTLWFSAPVGVPGLYVGATGIGYSAYGVQQDFNNASLKNIGLIEVTGSTGHVRCYADYNAGQGVGQSGFVHRYANRNVNADAAAFHVEDAADPNVRPFYVSSHGYMYLVNNRPEKPVVIAKGAAAQSANLFEAQDSAGTVRFSVSPGGNVQLPGNLIAYQGTVYSCNYSNVGYVNSDINIKALQGISFQPGNTEQARFNVGGTLQLNQAPTAANHAARKAEVDTKWTMWSGTQATFDAIGTKDPSTLYAITG